MSALPPIADILRGRINVRFVPKADMKELPRLCLGDPVERTNTEVDPVRVRHRLPIGSPARQLARKKTLVRRDQRLSMATVPGGRALHEGLRRVAGAEFLNVVEGSIILLYF